ncbi:MAG: NfeD family protein [Candidatus Sedimenticola sp. (ex Thyasira tokunagai)]
MSWLEGVTYWQWWVLAVLLIILEVFSPGAFFLWMGVSAGVVGLILMLVPGLEWEYQILIFAVFSVISVIAWRLVLKRNPTATDQPALNRRGEQYLDRVFTLETPVINGQGRIRVDDTTWKIHGPDCPAGSRVQVVGVDGVVLRVELSV